VIRGRDRPPRDSLAAPVAVTTDAQSDLHVFNRWLCVTRLRASTGIAVFVVALHLLDIGKLAVAPILLVCGFLCAFSLAALYTSFRVRRPRFFFYAQHIVDLAGVTVGVGLAHAGGAELLLRSIYLLVIIPASMMSVSSGLVVAGLATYCHFLLFGVEHGLSVAAFATLEAALPPFLFFVVAQQAFFYGRHLELKNDALAALASRLEEHRGRLAALVEVARTLNSTLEGPELLARMNHAALQHLGADWGATFLINKDRGTFRLAAASNLTARDADLERMEFPLDAWPAVRRISREGVVVVTGTDPDQISPLLTGGRGVAVLFLAGLYRDQDLVGFLALGYAVDAPPWSVVQEQLAAIAEHAAIALRNAQLLDDARQASALKSEFLSTVSHELRTPLHVISGFTEMLRDGAPGPLNDEQRELVHRIDARGRELLELIEAILHVGRIETGRDAISLYPVRLDDLVAALKSATAGIPRAAETTLDWKLPTDLEQVLVTDTAKVALVVRNLVSNACKFTPAGRVTVRVAFIPPTLTIEVQDTGIGMAPEQIPIIFDMFRQLESSLTRGHGGVGLGLYIVKQIIDRLGGTVSVESSPGRGSSFRITLNDARAEAEVGTRAEWRPGETESRDRESRQRQRIEISRAAQ